MEDDFQFQGECTYEAVPREYGHFTNTLSNNDQSSQRADNLVKAIKSIIAGSSGRDAAYDFIR